MGEYKSGTLKSSSRRKVKSRKQAFYLEPEHRGWPEAKLEWGDKGAAGLVFWQLIYP